MSDINRTSSAHHWREKCQRHESAEVAKEGALMTDDAARGVPRCHLLCSPQAPYLYINQPKAPVAITIKILFSVMATRLENGAGP